MKEKKGVKFDVELTAADLKELAEQFKAEYKKQLGEDFPSDPVQQLKLAIGAVFRCCRRSYTDAHSTDGKRIPRSIL